MDLFVFFTRFLYRIRHKLIFGTLVAVLLSVVLTSFLPKMYNVTTTIFTGFTSKASLDAGGRSDWNISNNAHDNIINLVKSKNTLENISIKLLAQHLIYGDKDNDNQYIMAGHYNKLLKLVPENVLALVDKTSFDNTVQNLKKYKREGRGNFIYEIFNWNNKYYGFISLSKIKVIRKGVSDMIDISYQCDDPGIAANTISFLNEELSLRYEILLMSAANDVVSYFEAELDKAKRQLDSSEINLVRFNTEHDIINYEEQTKHLAALNNAVESRYEETMLRHKGSEALIKQLEKQMETRVKLMMENKAFLDALADISALNGQIAEIEIFGAQDDTNTGVLTLHRDSLKRKQQSIQVISDKIDNYKFTKEGVSINNMVSEWLNALLVFEKSKAELDIMNKRREEIAKQYTRYSPVGPSLASQTRNVRVEESAYITILNNLGVAKMRQKNILMDAGMLQVVTPPDFPLITMPRKRELFVSFTFLGAILLITGFYLIIEMFDRTLRDGYRTEKLSGGKVIGAFPSGSLRSYRNFQQEISRISINYLANQLNRYISTGEQVVINILSIKKEEGKSHIAAMLKESWEERGFRVVSLSAKDDRSLSSRVFFHAKSINDLEGVAQKTEGADIVIVEHIALEEQNVPVPYLQEATINLLIANAQRAWESSDQINYNVLYDIVGKNKLFICLNNGDREAVEQYTGQLPPYTFFRRWVYRLTNLGITAK